MAWRETRSSNPIVPTLRVGMQLWTFRVRLKIVTRSVKGCAPTQSVGAIFVGGFPLITL